MDTAGHITALDNAPPEIGADTAQLRAWISELDIENPPLVQPGVGTIHYGTGTAARRFASIAALEGAVLLCLALSAGWASRRQVAAARDRLWVAMARESAHQLGTPLMSLTGWIAYLRENPGTTGVELAEHLQADAERLERVAKRFERIGRPARREPVGLGALAEIAHHPLREPGDARATRDRAGPDGARRSGAARMGARGRDQERDRRALGRQRADRRGGGCGRPHRAAGRRRRRSRRAPRGAGAAVRAGSIHQAGGVGHRTGPRASHRRATARRSPGVPASPDRGGSRVRARIPTRERAVSLALNPQQDAAVRHPGGPLLVLAGAGSGKTRVLTARIAHLIRERGVAPSRLFAVTFTNRAAGEMRARVAALLGADPRGLWIGTFHALSARLLRREAALLGFGPNFTIYDQDDSESFIKRLMEQRGHSPKANPPRAIHAIISSAKNRMMLPEELGASADGPLERVAAEIYAGLGPALRQANAMDFDDLLLFPLTLFAEHPERLAYWQRRFDHVLVDEFQDTNAAQYRLVKQLAMEHRNLCVVGDDDQAIYGWRGADVRHMLSFQQDFPGTTLIKLEQNYRSTQVKSRLHLVCRLLLEKKKKT